MNVFPNPAALHEPITLTLGRDISGIVQVDVFSSAGDPVYHEAFFKATEVYQHTIVLRQLSKGLYVLQVTNGGYRALQKLILE